MRYIKMPAGGTLSQIAQEANIPIDAILRANPDLDPRRIPVGQTITIPDTKEKPPTTADTYKKRLHQSSKSKSDKDVKSKPKKKCKCVPPPWMKIAKGEIGVQRYRNQHKKGDNPRIMEYHKTAFNNTKVKYTEKTSWCGSFVNWTMEQAGYKGVKSPAWALNWRKFGKRCDRPVYGAIGVKKRIVFRKVKDKATGRITTKRYVYGHVSFFVGKSKDGKYYYMLGGNQTGASKVIVEKYPKKVWDQGFYVPKDYDCSKCETPIYKGISSTGKDGK